MTAPTMTLLCGLPGAGKSWWALHNAGGALVLTADAIREGANPREVFSRIQAQARAALDEGRDILVDVCALRPRDRAEWAAIARAAGAATHLVLFRTPAHICRFRDSRRASPARIDWSGAAERLTRAWIDTAREGWGKITVIR